MNINQAQVCILVRYAPTGFLPAEILASLTRVMIEAMVGTAPEVPLSIEIEPLSMLRNAFLKGQIVQIYFSEFMIVRLVFSRVGAYIGKCPLPQEKRPNFNLRA